MATETEARRPDPAVRDAGGDLSPAFHAAVEHAVAGEDATEARKLSGALHEADVGDLIAALEPEARTKFIRLLGDDFDFTVLTELDDTIRAQILEEMPAEAVAEGVRDLESDDAVSILEDLGPEEQAEILEKIPPVERVALARALDYPEESAGRLMQTDLIAVPPFWTVGQTIDHLRESADLPDEFYQLFVVDPAHRLIGTVSLNHLLRSKRPTPISAITDPARHLVKAVDDQEDVARLFQRYNLVSAAVVDDAGRLVGVITVDDVVDVIEEEADEDLKALGGVAAGEELSDSVWTIARGRFSWLFVNLLTAILASMVIGIFESELQRMVALAVLMPIVASQGGNAGTQTMTVAVRALATRELGPKNAARVIGRELLVGLFNGLAFAVIIGLIATAWFHVPDLGIVIGLAMLINLVAAALGGILIPLGLRWLRADPAVASGAFVTTVTDVTGFFAFLALATWWFGLY
jgi:magnesium transporter